MRIKLTIILLLAAMIFVQPVSAVAVSAGSAIVVEASTDGKHDKDNDGACRSRGR